MSDIVSTKFLIVGGGVSGLMFANTICSDDWILLEKEKECGGYCRTIYQDGFIWDYAGHFFHFSDKDIRDFFNAHIDEEEIIVAKKITKIYYGGHFIDFPFQANIHQLPKQDFIDCLYDLYFRREQVKSPSFLSMLYGNYGKSITDLFLRPYNEKLYACNLDLLDSGAMGRFFPHVKTREIIAGFRVPQAKSYNDSFSYPKRGARVFVDALQRQLPVKNFRMEETLLGVDTLNKVAHTSKGQIRYQSLINTLPLKRLIPILGDKALMDQGKGLSANKVLVLNMGFNRKSDFTDIHWAYFPSKEINFYRIGFYDNILKGDRLSLYVEIGFPEGSKIDVDRHLEETLFHLRQIGVISDHKLLSYSAIVLDPAYVHITTDLNSNRKNILRSLEERAVYSIGRYGRWKYCSIEDSLLDAKRLATSMNEQ